MLLALYSQMLGVADLRLGLASTLPLLQPLKHPSPQYMEALSLGFAILAPHIIFAAVIRMLPSDTDSSAIPHPLL